MKTAWLVFDEWGRITGDYSGRLIADAVRRASDNGAQTANDGAKMVTPRIRSLKKSV